MKWGRTSRHQSRRSLCVYLSLVSIQSVFYCLLPPLTPQPRLIHASTLPLQPRYTHHTRPSIAQEICL